MAEKGKMKKQIATGSKIIIPKTVFMIKKRTPLSKKVFLEEGIRQFSTIKKDYLAIIRQDINHFKQINRKNRKKRKYLFVAEKLSKAWYVYGDRDIKVKSKKRARGLLLHKWKKRDKTIEEIEEREPIVIRPDPKDIGKKRYKCEKCKWKTWTKRKPTKCRKCGSDKIIQYFRL